MWISLIALLFVYCVPALGAQKSVPVNVFMIQFHEHLKFLAPVLFNAQDFVDDRNEDMIFDHLGGFELTTLQMEHSKIFSRNLGDSVMFDVLMRAVGDANRAFQDGNKGYSRMMLRAAISTCTGCHTSGANTKTFQFLADDKIYDSLPNDTSRLELSLTTRQFDKAKGLAESILEKFPENAANASTLSYAAEQLATYYARIHPSAEKAVSYFSKVHKNQNLPLDVRNDILDYQKGFEKVRESKKTKLNSSTAILKDIRQKIGFKKSEPLLAYDNKFIVARMQAVGDVHRLLRSNQIRSGKELAEAIHYLGLINNLLNRDFVSQIDDAYFVVCIETVPHSDVAIGCYRSLNESIQTKSSGSAGVFIELEDLRMLARYKRLAYPIFPQIKK